MSDTPRDEAIRYSALLRALMVKRRLTNAAISDALGVATSTVSNWKTGTTLPTVENMEVLADLMESNRLLNLGMELRTKMCALEDCGQTFVDNSRRMKQKYCKPRHASLASARKVRGVQADSAKQAYAELAIHREAVRRGCEECEPRGICHDGECVYRSVSPFPLVRRRDVGIAEPSSEKMIDFLVRRYG